MMVPVPSMMRSMTSGMSLSQRSDSVGTASGTSPVGNLSVAPLAFYFRGDLLNDYSNLQLIGTISTMETFQKIYRPEVYNANSAAAAIYQPSLGEQDYSRTQIAYDRVERSQLAVKQAKYTEEHFITPHKDLLDRWTAKYPVLVN